MLAVIYIYRSFVLRLQGEASYIEQGETEGEDGKQEPESFEVAQPERLLVKKLGKEFLVAVNDIEWVEASGNYANLHVKKKIYPMRITMAKLEKTLPLQQFARVHRSAIVNLAQVSEIEPQESGDYHITLHNGHQLNLSRRYRQTFRDLLSL
ncbi:MAG: hypothetical protein COA42_10745 [Alteromonadaceae bacterium]|nr:MAG: hypothetical protein COA42_10745 [Alteromonadaceae bacterium]